MAITSYHPSASYPHLVSLFGNCFTEEWDFIASYDYLGEAKENLERDELPVFRHLQIIVLRDACIHAVRKQIQLLEECCREIGKAIENTPFEEKAYISLFNDLGLDSRGNADWTEYWSFLNKIKDTLQEILNRYEQSADDVSIEENRTWLQGITAGFFGGDWISYCRYVRKMHEKGKSTKENGGSADSLKFMMDYLCATHRKDKTLLRESIKGIEEILRETEESDHAFQNVFFWKMQTTHLPFTTWQEHKNFLLCLKEKLQQILSEQND